MSEKPYANVREMARKFEGLAKEVNVSTPTVSIDNRRKLAYLKRPKKPVKPLPVDRASGSSSSSSNIRTDDDDDNEEDEDDDLLFDKLITDINIPVKHFIVH